MAIRIIAEDEKLAVTIQGATFTYRRMPAHVRAKIVDDYTAKRSGNVNWGKASLAMMRHALVAWEGVIDGAGNSVPLTAETISYLPDTVQSELMELLGDNADLDGDIKNSESSQPSKP